MAYALFCHEAKLSKAYPTEADVWRQAKRSGLLVDVASGYDKATPRPVLENDYEIRPCPADPQDDPAENQAEAEWQVETDSLPFWAGGRSDQVVLTNPNPASLRSASAWKQAVASRVLSGLKTGWKHRLHRGRI